MLGCNRQRDLSVCTSACQPCDPRKCTRHAAHLMAPDPVLEAGSVPPLLLRLPVDPSPPDVLARAVWLPSFPLALLRRRKLCLAVWLPSLLLCWRESLALWLPLLLCRGS